MRLITMTLASTVAITLGACDSGTPTANQEAPASKQTTIEAPPPQAAPSTEPPPAVAKPAATINGRYSNGGSASATLMISNQSTKKFDFHLRSQPSKDGEGDACGGIDYTGVGTFDPAKGAAPAMSASTDAGGNIRFSEGKANFEPALDMIGMDCARVFETEFASADAP